MGEAFTFDGVLYDTEGEFLDALAREYGIGNTEAVVYALETYGYTLQDIHVRPGKEG